MTTFEGFNNRSEAKLAFSTRLLPGMKYHVPLLDTLLTPIQVPNYFEPSSTTRKSSSSGSTALPSVLVLHGSKELQI